MIEIRNFLEAYGRTKINRSRDGSYYRIKTDTKEAVNTNGMVKVFEHTSGRIEVVYGTESLKFKILAQGTKQPVVVDYKEVNTVSR